MKKILFPTFNRVHEARQGLLLEELSREFEIHISTYGEKKLKMSEVAVDIAGKFQNALNQIKPDLALLRGDRYEILVPAMLCAYNNIPIAHIEGFDLSGVIDQRVRYAVSYLSDYHFVTNDESYQRALSMGFKNVWNEGSLDCEYALSVKPLKLRSNPYILVLWHPTPEEPGNELYEAIKAFPDYEIVGIRGNKDYGIESSYKEEYPPDEFINLLRGASCVVGNSSCLIKECSVLSVPCVLVGERQKNRLRPKNVKDAEYDKEDIEYCIKKQFHYDKGVDLTYYKPDCSKRISDIITSLVG